MISPNATALLTAGIFPAPTGANDQFTGAATAPTNLKEEIVRIDHNFSSKFSVFGHFIAEQVSQGFAISQWSGANIPTVGDHIRQSVVQRSRSYDVCDQPEPAE